MSALLKLAKHATDVIPMPQGSYNPKTQLWEFPDGSQFVSGGTGNPSTYSATTAGSQFNADTDVDDSGT